MKSVRTHISGYRYVEAIDSLKKPTLEPNKHDPGLKNGTAMWIKSEVILSEFKVSRAQEENRRDSCLQICEGESSKGKSALALRESVCAGANK